MSMEHEYYWTFDRKSVPADSYRVYWKDRVTSLEVCSTEVKLTGPDEAIQQALVVTAMTLRDQNSALFIEPEPDNIMMEELR